MMLLQKIVFVVERVYFCVATAARGYRQIQGHGHGLDHGHDHGRGHGHGRHDGPARRKPAQPNRARPSNHIGHLENSWEKS